MFVNFLPWIARELLSRQGYLLELVESELVLSHGEFDIPLSFPSILRMQFHQRVGES